MDSEKVNHNTSAITEGNPVERRFLTTIDSAYLICAEYFCKGLDIFDNNEKDVYNDETCWSAFTGEGVLGIYTAVDEDMAIEMAAEEHDIDIRCINTYELK